MNQEAVIDRRADIVAIQEHRLTGKAMGKPSRIQKE
jgi:hypothetical protein